VSGESSAKFRVIFDPADWSWWTPPWQAREAVDAIRRGNKPVSDSMKDFVAKILSDGRSAGEALLARSIQDLLLVGGEATEHANRIASDMRDILSDIAAGRVEYEDGRMALDRHVSALAMLADGTKEAAAATAIRRSRQALALAGELALRAAQVLGKIAVGALVL